MAPLQVAVKAQVSSSWRQWSALCQVVVNEVER